MNGRLHDDFYAGRECGHQARVYGQKSSRCLKPAAYEFFLEQWPDAPGLACAEHVQNIRRWKNLVRVQSLRGPVASLAGVGRGLGMAVGTEETEVLEPVVRVDPVDVVQLQSEWTLIPDGT